MYNELVNEVRLTYHYLTALGETLHGAYIDLPGRAVLEFLSRRGAAAVPEIARSRHVSRQHIQTIVNGLLDRGLVKAEANPAHRSSNLLELTERGRELIEGVFARERRFIEPLNEVMEPSTLAATTKTLAALRTHLSALTLKARA